MNKKAFVFMYADMDLGGIQKHIYGYIKSFRDEAVDIFWIAPDRAVIDAGWASAMKHVRIVRPKEYKGLYKILSSYERVAAITYSLLQFEQMRKILHYDPKFRMMYIIPHFQNPELYPEEYFKTKFWRSKVRKWMREFYDDYLSANEVFFINPKHARAIGERYNFSQEIVASRLCKKTRKVAEFDREAIEKKLKTKQEFNIITVARFEFPHKGYILGLIDAFSEIKKICSKARLYIIGYGEGESDVRRKLNELPQDIADDIILPGKVSFEELQQYYNKAHLSVAVAGSVTDGALFGVPTLVARHYCEKCEVYGNYISCTDKTLSVDPGNDVLPYIEAMLRMSDDEYRQMCYDTYKTAKNIVEDGYDPYWIYKTEQKPSIKHSSVKIGILRIRAFIWTWTKRVALLVCNPKMFLKKLMKKFGRNGN